MRELTATLRRVPVALLPAQDHWEGWGELVACQYAEAMQRGDRFPPIEIWSDESGNLDIKDGYHRLRAAQILGRKTILAYVFPIDLE